MAASASPSPDAKYRPFRRVTWGLYFAVTFFFAGSIIYSVIVSALEMTPPHKPPQRPALAPEVCVTRARALWGELDARRKAMSDQPEVRRVDAEWTAFRVDWLTRERDLEASCTVDAAGREGIKALFARLEKTMNLYTTHAVQFAGEVGPTVDALKASFGGGGP